MSITLLACETSAILKHRELYSGLCGDLNGKEIQRRGDTCIHVGFPGIFSSVQFSRSVVSNSLRPHESQHARPPYPSPTHILVVKNLPASAKDTGDMGLIPGSGRSPRGGNGNPLWYSCLENPMDRGPWWAMAHGVAESDVTE